MNTSIRFLYCDEFLAIIDKPAGLLVHRGWASDSDVAVDRVRRELGPLASPAHRLDRQTSGALLFSRTPEIASTLGALISTHAIEKQYLALVRGVPESQGRIDHPIPRTEDGPRVPAVTRFRTLAASPIERCALVEAIPETGRLHQIRRHMKHLSHPLIGDANYGKGALNRHFRDVYGLSRLALHAQTMRFIHPATGENICARAPVPDDLRVPLEKLGFNLTESD